MVSFDIIDIIRDHTFVLAFRFVRTADSNRVVT